MKALRVVLSILIYLFMPTSLAFADDLTSPNYKIVDATTTAGGDVNSANSGDYNLLNTIGSFSGDPRIFSSTYRAGLGAVEVFTANVPKISCFETTSSGSSQCTTGPSYLNSNGVVTVCGPTGCYSQARFEIDTQKNPADTLYGIQISTDAFASDIRYIDGVTFKPKTANQRTIADYLTKSQWETEVLNVKGLDTNTQYYIRAVALHGDFTESDPGPMVSATTANASMSFDIDIAGETGITAESNPPFDATFSTARKLIQTGPAQTAVDLIWLDLSTNALGGFALVQKGTNGGLHSTSQSYTIPSGNIDLDGVTEGFGLQHFYGAQEDATGSGNGDLGIISVATPYDVTGNNVGQVDQVFIKMYESNKPVLNGRLGIKILARASSSTPPASDYSEDLTLIMVPRY